MANAVAAAAESVDKKSAAWVVITPTLPSFMILSTMTKPSLRTWRRVLPGDLQMRHAAAVGEKQKNILGVCRWYFAIEPATEDAAANNHDESD